MTFLTSPRFCLSVCLRLSPSCQLYVSSFHSCFQQCFSSCDNYQKGRPRSFQSDCLRISWSGLYSTHTPENVCFIASLYSTLSFFSFINQNTFHSLRKNAIIFPIPKHENSSDPNNYRLITLTFVIQKDVEPVIANHLPPLFESERLINCQYRLCSCRSTNDVLALILDS